MRRRTRNMPSPSMVVAFTALLLALGGTAVALPGNNTVTSGDIKNGQVKTQDIRNNTVQGKDIRNNTVLGKDIRNSTIRGKDVRNNTLTGADIDESTLATVPRAILAAGSDTANRAASLDGLTKVRGFRRVASSSSDPDQATARAGATEVVLLTAGPLTVYGKCYTDTDNTAGDEGTFADAYIKTSQDGAIFDADNDQLDGDPAFLDTSTAEDDRELEDAGTFAVDAASIDADEDGNFAAAAPDGTTIEGRVEMAAKNGTLANGNGLYGAGNACLFWGNQLN